METPPILGKTPRNKVCVLFFGTKEFGFIDLDKIEDYTINRVKNVAKGKSFDFHLAVKQMDEFISNPVKYKSHAVAKPMKNKIKIKTEHEVERRLGVKKERASNRHSTDLQVENNLNSNAWLNEKQKMIDKIVSLKTENDKNLLQLKKQQTDYVSLLNEKENLEKTVNEINIKFSVQVNALQSQLFETKDEFIASKANHEKIIIDLKREKQVLQAQIKQYQTGIEQKKTMENDTSEQNNEFEVEAILNHKETKDGRKYLVRWKGFGPDGDTWENVHNLSCPKILNKYLRSLNLNKK